MMLYIPSLDGMQRPQRELDPEARPLKSKISSAQSQIFPHNISSAACVSSKVNDTNRCMSSRIIRGILGLEEKNP
jgi:hypothetical protein